MARLRTWRAGRLGVLLLLAASSSAAGRLITAEDMLDDTTDPCLQSPAAASAGSMISGAAWRSNDQHSPRRVRRLQLSTQQKRRHLQQQQQSLKQQKAVAVLQAWTWERYHSYNETASFLAALAAAFPDTCSLASIGKSVQGRDLWVVQATRTSSASTGNTTTSSGDGGRSAAAAAVVVGRPRGQGDLGTWTAPALSGSGSWLRMKSAPWFSKPIVALIGNMHGDEDVNRQVLLQFALQLCSLGTLGNLTVAGAQGASGTSSSSSSKAEEQVAQRITRLLDNTVVQILPCMNPDSGFKPSLQRHNARGVDLNRNFWTQDFLPSYDRPTRTTSGAQQSAASQEYLVYGAAEAQPETRAVMAWLRQSLPRLSANMHGGALVGSYLRDACDQLGKVDWCPAPEDPLPQFLALAYALNHQGGMRQQFTNGTTQGAAWYPALGTMQDWVYLALGRRMHVTFELHEDKTLTGLEAAQLAAQLPAYYAQNRNALLRYTEMAHLGLRVRLVDKSTRAPLAATATLLQPAASDPSPYPDLAAGSPSWNVPSGGELSLMAVPGGKQYVVEVQPYSVCNSTATYPAITLTHTPKLGWDQALFGTGLAGLGDVQVVAVQATF